MKRWSTDVPSDPKNLWNCNGLGIFNETDLLTEIRLDFKREDEIRGSEATMRGATSSSTARTAHLYAGCLKSAEDEHMLVAVRV